MRMVFALTMVCGGLVFYVTATAPSTAVGAVTGAAAVPKFSLTSGAFRNGREIPAKYTCDGENLSPPLSWEGFPEGTESFVIICTDPDAPGKVWIHWVAYDIPTGTVRLEEGAGKVALEKAEWGMQGKNTFQSVGYGGPCPPPGKVHHYNFTIYALKTPKLKFVDVVKPVDAEDVREAMKGNVIGVGRIMGTYSK